MNHEIKAIALDINGYIQLLNSRNTENQFEGMYKNQYRLKVFLNYCMFLIYLPVSHADTAPTLL